jgi:hypothetical protein
MNKKQKVVCWIGGVLFLLSICNAPWKIESSRDERNIFTHSVEHVHRYSDATGPLWEPPHYYNGSAKVELATSQLFVQWMAIAGVAVALLFLLKSRPK